MQPPVQEVFITSGFDHVIASFATRAEATATDA
jgi:hypothetical protein